MSYPNVMQVRFLVYWYIVCSYLVYWSSVPPLEGVEMAMDGCVLTRTWLFLYSILSPNGYQGNDTLLCISYINTLFS